MTKALLIIDYTHDFVAADGKLTCGEPGQQIEGRMVELIDSFLKNGDVVIFANDIHYEGDTFHPETKLFPPHNIEGTNGRELYGAVKTIYEANKKNCISFNKTRYSAFAGTNLAILLRERKIQEVHLTGVCTDICVLHTAMDAYNLGFNIVVHEDAVASFNPEGHTWALKHFTGSLGAKVVSKES
ncbi:isochorismatase family cysteine hydrolase [Metasolibacillus sp. FSL K6-0083]|uniref:cysteine hydrolase family protein n=1 Tax=Metasolibacillus sp. FSL K6-0083 TaxID=2921416 RepID=UPI00315AC590